MILDISKILTCRCPVCNERFFTDITPFKITGGSEFECDICESGLLEIKKSGSGYLIKIPCFICEETHSYTLSFDSMWRKKLNTLGCSASGIDILYIGDKKDVYDASFENDDMLTELTNSLPDDLYDDISPVFQDAIEVINNRIMHGLITCGCKSCEIIIKICKSGFTVSCGNCGKSRFIPLETAEDIDNLKNLYFINLE